MRVCTHTVLAHILHLNLATPILYYASLLATMYMYIFYICLSLSYSYHTHSLLFLSLEANAIIPILYTQVSLLLLSLWFIILQTVLLIVAEQSIRHYKEYHKTLHNNPIKNYQACTVYINMISCRTCTCTCINETQLHVHVPKEYFNDYSLYELMIKHYSDSMITVIR